jgi:ligand-binding sensor domain-containing protein/DNA-binding CsgD family transcriptional regulator
MISQDKNHFLFFANNEGLLECNGTKWNLYKSPNETIIRSVKVVDDIIYTGCYMEFGYWKRLSNGELKYYSLSNKIKNKLFVDEQFWNILNVDKWIIFQSLNRIYIYDTENKNYKIITSNDGILKSFKLDNSIYFQIANKGLFEIENGKSRLVTSDSKIKNSKIVSILPDENGIIIHTQFNSFFKLSNKTITKLNFIDENELQQSISYSSCKLSNGNYVIGTISNGIYIISNTGKIVYNINQIKGLSNNTALSLFEDFDKNLWIGLDNGINCINLQSPVKSYSDNTGKLGTVYATIQFKNKLYIGTNQGLFFKDINSNDQFQFVKGIKGQVWSLFEYDNTLFCGHDLGTFIIEGENANCIYSKYGTFCFRTTYNKNILLQGNYYGISVLEKQNNQWKFKNKIQGFDYSSKYFELISKNEICVSHEYNGVFKIDVDNNFTQSKNLESLKIDKGKNAGLIKYNNDIFYAYEEGIFKLNKIDKTFKKDTLLSAIFVKDKYTSGRMIVDKSNKIWLFSKNYIHYFTLNKLNYQLKENTIPIPSSLTNSMLGYENITLLENSEYLIGTTDGYYIIDIDNLSFKNYSVLISNVSVNKQNEASTSLSITEKGNLKHEQNNLTFTYSVAEYDKYINAEYQYKLEGFQDSWSLWSAVPTINFKNLSPGDYKFIVRSKIASSNLENSASYTFTILKPWYLTNLALIIYALIFGIVAIFINKQYKNYYQKQNEKLIEENNLLLEIKELENEQQLMKLRNEKLSQDVDNKNKELAVSNMTLIKKDELLSLIKEDLKKTEVEENKVNSIKSVISNITKSINKEDSWNTFKDAFENADKDFFKKIKDAHPTLTPNDLRLCAYLRLNLSSKEIAPLLNISVRSVEIKRYRLRKKMDLFHDQGLVDYILSV